MENNKYKNFLNEDSGRSLRSKGYEKLTGDRDARIKKDNGWTVVKSDEGDWYGLKPSSSGSSSSLPSTPFTTKEEGDKFRAWVNDNYPEYAKTNKLDRQGKFNNTYIKKAWKEYGDAYKKSLTPSNEKQPAQQPSEKPSEKKQTSQPVYDSELKSFSRGAGFYDWSTQPYVISRVRTINDLITNQKAQSDVFYYFYKSLDFANKVYPNKEYGKLIDELKSAENSRNPSGKEIELGNFIKKDLGDTGLWEKGRYFYYVPFGKTQTVSRKNVIDQYKRDGWQDRGGEPLSKNEVDEYDTIDLREYEPDLFKEPYILVRNIVDIPTEDIIKEVRRYEMTGNFDRKVCKKIIGGYHSLFKKEINGEKIPISNAELVKFKKAVQSCDAKHNNFYDFDVTNTKITNLKDETNSSKKLSLANKTTTTTSNTKQVSDSYINLKQTIKENLIMEKQKKLIKETKVIEDRLQFVVESVGLKNRKDVDRIVEGIFYEMLDLEKNNYNREVMTENIQAIFDVLGSLFGGTKNGVVGTFKEKGINYILNKLGLDKNSYMGDFLEVVFGNVDLKDIPRLFTDCDFLTKKIAEAVPEAYLKNLQDEKGFDNIFMDYVRNTLYDVIRESDIVQKLEDRISGIVCPITAGLTSKFEDKLTDMKSSLSS